MGTRQSRIRYLLRIWSTLKHPINWIELTNTDYEGTNIIHLPIIFEVYNCCISLNKALIIDFKMKELPEWKTLQELQRQIKNDWNSYFASTPKIFLEKFVNQKALFNKNQIYNWRQFVIMEIKQFDSFSQNQMEKWIEYMKTMSFIDKFWFYTDHKILQSKFARKILDNAPQINISIVLETPISDNEGSYKFEIGSWKLVEYDFDNKILKMNDLSSCSVIAYSMKQAYLFHEKYVVFPEFEIKTSKVARIYWYWNEEIEDIIIKEYYNTCWEINTEFPESFQSHFGLIIPIDSIKLMGFSFSFPYKSEKNIIIKSFDCYYSWNEVEFGLKYIYNKIILINFFYWENILIFFGKNSINDKNTRTIFYRFVFASNKIDSVIDVQRENKRVLWYFNQRKHCKRLLNFMKSRCMSFVNGLNGIVKHLNKSWVISIKQDEWFINGVKAKSIIPRKYDIQDFMSDLLISDWVKLIKTFPLSLSTVKEYPELTDTFLSKFRKIRKLICIDDMYVSKYWN